MKFTYTPYKESDAVKKAQTALNTHLKNEPSKYKSQWQTQLDDTINKILNREKFSYDFNGDALYQQYKDKFVQQGKMASADVMGQAAAMTGGYGNSYAASVGNQAYQASLQNLNDIVPELYQMALDKYNQEGQDLYNQYGIVADRENTDYGRYRDTVSDWMTNRDYLANRFDSERNFDYGMYSDNKSYAYQDHRNGILDDQWNREYQLAVDKYNTSNEQWQKEYELAERNIDAEIEAAVEEALAKVEPKVVTKYIPTGTTEEASSPEEFYKAKAVVNTQNPYAGFSSQADWTSYFLAIKDKYGESAAYSEYSKAMNSIPIQYRISIGNAIRSNLGRH